MNTPVSQVANPTSAASAAGPQPPSATDLSSTLLAGVVSGVVVAVLNFVLTRRKTRAEIAKLELDAEKLRRELSQSIDAIPGAVTHALASAAERIIYATAGGAVGHDFTGQEAKLWQKVDGKDQPISDLGRGSLSFTDDGSLNISRSNTDGRYEVWLTRYTVDGKEHARIPRDDHIEGVRSLRLSGEAKAVGGEHTLRFVFKNESANTWADKREHRVTTNAWTPFSLHFRVSPSEECRLRIDDLDISKAPSSLQLRNIVLAEKTSPAK